MSNYCPNCGQKLNPDVKFCGNCGTRINNNTQGSVNRNMSTYSKMSYNATARTQTHLAAEKAAKQRIQTRTPQKSLGMSGVLCVFLSVVLFVEFLVAGFKYPGFLIDKPKDSSDYVANTKTNDKTDITTSERPRDNILTDEDWLSDENAVVHDGDPAYINVSITEEDIENSPKVTAWVSKDAPVCTFDDVSVDLKNFNLENENDTLIMHTLGEKQDETSETKLLVYDFSLESGQDSFFADVDITIPRPSDGSGDGIIYYNPETGKWEPTSYDISEDGKNYILHTNHFSTEAVQLKYPVKTEKMLGTFYLGKQAYLNADDGGLYTYNGYDLLKEPLMINDEKLTEVFHESLDDPAFIKSVVGTNQLKEEATMGYLLDKTLGTKVKNYLMNDVGKRREQVDNALSIFGPFYEMMTKEEKKALEVFGEKIPKGLAYISTVLVISKITIAAWNNAEFYDYYEEYKVDVANCAIGFVASSIGGMPGAVIGAATTLISLFAGDNVKSLAKEKYDPLPKEGMAFQYYLENKCFHRGTPLRLSGEGWDYVVKNAFEVDKADHKGEALNQKIEEYLDLFWDLSLEEKQQILTEYEKSIAVNPNITSWEWNEPDDTSLKRYKERARKRLYLNIKPMVEAEHKSLINQMEEQFKKQVYAEYLPYMNTPLVFEVVDRSLPEGTTFDMSQYASYLTRVAERQKNGKGINPEPSENEGDPMDEFVVGSFNIKRPLCKPLDVSMANYAKPFRPLVEAGSNRIFSCRMYYYFMYGMPKSITFDGDKETGLKPYPAIFTIPKSGNVRRVVIEIGEEKKKEEVNKSIETDLCIAFENNVNTLRGYDNKVFNNLTPCNNHISVHSDGEIDIYLPVIDVSWTVDSNAADAETCSFSRDMINIKGKVFKTMDASSRSGSKYTVLQGFIENSSDFKQSLNYSCGDFSSTNSTTISDLVSGKDNLERGSAVNIYYFPDNGNCYVDILLRGRKDEKYIFDATEEVISEAVYEAGANSAYYINMSTDPNIEKDFDPISWKWAE